MTPTSALTIAAACVLRIALIREIHNPADHNHCFKNYTLRAFIGHRSHYHHDRLTGNGENAFDRDLGKFFPTRETIS
jgi:hypothetical protein